MGANRRTSRNGEDAAMGDPVRRLAVGTAQFGMDYGVANAAGRMTFDDARAVVQLARANGIDTIDTAVAYGESQSTLGRIGVEGLRVVTKLPAFAGSAEDVRGWVGRTVDEALAQLRLPTIYALMFHHAGDLVGPYGAALYQEVLRLRDAGKVSRIGVSVYDSEELAAVALRYSVDLVQAPYNVFDQRIAESGWLDRLADSGVEIHTRSVFLQGLLLMNALDRPAYFLPWFKELREWDEWCRREAMSPLEAALGFVLRDRRVDRVLVGIDGPAQLSEIRDAARRVDDGDRYQGSGVDDPALVNPSFWRV